MTGAPHPRPTLARGYPGGGGKIYFYAYPQIISLSFATGEWLARFRTETLFMLPRVTEVENILVSTSMGLKSDFYASLGGSYISITTKHLKN